MKSIREVAFLIPVPLKRDRQQVMRMVLPMVVVQEFMVFLMYIEAYDEMQFYQVQSRFYKVLRYIIVFAIYLLFSKDWKSVSHMFMVNKLFMNNNFWYSVFCYMRACFVGLNELVIFQIAFCSNIGEDRGIGLIVNFGAALIICELDDIIMSSGRIQYWRELFDNQPDESGDPDEDNPKLP